MTRLLLLLALFGVGCSQSTNLPNSNPAPKETSADDDGETHAPAPPGDDA